MMSCTKLHGRRQGCHGTRGQALIEFAVVASLFALLCGGVIEFGRVWSAAQLLNAAARDGARLAAVTAKNSRKSVVESRVVSTASPYFQSKDLSVRIQTGKGAGNEPTVTVSATGTLTTLFGNLLFGTTVDLSRSVTMRDETVAN